MAFDHLSEGLAERKAASLYRRRRTLHSQQGVEVVVDGHPFLAFCSNDYLGLAADDRLKQAVCEAAQRCGVGGGASHLVIGHHQEHHALEQELAEFMQVDRVLCFSTGYMANLGAIAGLLSKSDQVFEDRLNHASLIDAGLMSGARFQRYQHCSVENLKYRINKTFDKAHDRLVVTDGVFSMDGDIAPLVELAEVCRQSDAWLMVDDAHGFGVIGEEGEGCVRAAGLTQNDVALSMGTLGKAFGSFGAFVGGQEVVIESLIQQARTYIYTTSIPPAIAAASRESLRIVRSEHWRREHLSTLIAMFKEGAKCMGLQLAPSNTPIQPIIIGEDAAAIGWSRYLEDHGVLVTAIRPPTVPKGTARLRVTFSASHTEAHVGQLLELIRKGLEAGDLVLPERVSL